MNANSNREFKKAYDLLLKVDLSNASQRKLIRNTLMKGFLESQIEKLEESVSHLEYVIHNIDDVDCYSQQEKIYLKGYAAFCLKKFYSSVDSTISFTELESLISKSKAVNLTKVRNRFMRFFPLRYHPEWELLGKY